MNNTHTSQPLSKLLFENGCELESEYYWAIPLDKKKAPVILEPEISEFGDRGYKGAYEKDYPAYDILNDICVRYAKEFFGEGGANTPFMLLAYQYHPRKVLFLLQQGKKQEAEDYIWEHCLFNPKNK